MKFDHIGVVVSDLKFGRRLLEESIGVRQWTDEFRDPVNEIYAQFGLCGSGICYELVAPTSEKSPVWSSLSRKVNIINHVAYLVGDIAKEGARLNGAGFVAIAEPKPAIAYNGHRIQFFVSNARFIVELIEAPDHRHTFGFRAQSAS